MAKDETKSPEAQSSEKKWEDIVEKEVEPSAKEDLEAMEAALDEAVENETEAAAPSGSEIQVLEHPSYKKLENQLTETEKKAHEYWDQLMRLKAELQNANERSKRELEKAHRFSIEGLLKKLLPVLDCLEQALEAESSASSGQQDPMREGVALTLKMFQDVLEGASVAVIDPKGEAFNPAFHEAMSMQAGTDAAPGTVITVVQKGYLLFDRVVRPARVIVAKE